MWRPKVSRAFLRLGAATRLGSDLVAQNCRSVRALIGQDGHVAEPVPTDLRERFLQHFLDAWPERDVAEDRIRSSLVLVIEDEVDGPTLTARLLGQEVSFGLS